MSNLVIAGVCIDAPGNGRGRSPKDKEHVELEVRGLILGYTIEHRTNPGTPQEGFETYFAFTDEAPIGVERIVVHSGTGTANVDNHRTWHVYADGESGEGRYWLNDTGERILVRDPQGKIVDDQTVPAGHCGKITKPKPRPNPVVYPVPGFSNPTR